MGEENGALGRLMISIASSITVVALFFFATFGLVDMFWSDEDDDVVMGRVKLIFISGPLIMVILFVASYHILHPNYKAMDFFYWFLIWFNVIYVVVGIICYVIGKKEKPKNKINDNRKRIK